MRAEFRNRIQHLTQKVADVQTTLLLVAFYILLSPLGLIAKIYDLLRINNTQISTWRLKRHIEIPTDSIKLQY